MEGNNEVIEIYSIYILYGIYIQLNLLNYKFGKITKVDFNVIVE